MGIAFVVWWLAFGGTELSLTASITYFIMGLNYEWIHYLVSCQGMVVTSATVATWHIKQLQLLRVAYAVVQLAPHACVAGAAQVGVRLQYCVSTTNPAIVATSVLYLS